MVNSAPNIRREVSRRLVEAGFVRHDAMHRLPLKDGVSFIVDTGPLGGMRDIAPWVGLRHDQVEMKRAEFHARPPDPFGATVGANVGYILKGEYASWFSTADSSEPLLQIDRAKQILGRFVELRRLPEIFDIPGTKSPGYQRRLAIIFHLLGDVEAADEWLSKAEASDCRVDDELCADFRRFRQRLLADRASSA
jgi:hypothetical protein